MSSTYLVTIRARSTLFTLRPRLTLLRKHEHFKLSYLKSKVSFTQPMQKYLNSFLKLTCKKLLVTLKVLFYQISFHLFPWGGFHLNSKQFHNLYTPFFTHSIQKGVIAHTHAKAGNYYKCNYILISRVSMLIYISTGAPMVPLSPLAPAFPCKASQI